MDSEDQSRPADYVWWQPPWRWDWYQWVFVLALGFWLNLTFVLFFTDFVDWIPLD